MGYKSTKLFDGFSCCFRQWKAEDTHCKFLHGYGISFRVTFEGDLEDGELEIGQIAGLIHDIKPVAEIVEDMMTEFEEAKSQVLQF